MERLVTAGLFLNKSRNTGTVVLVFEDELWQDQTEFKWHPESIQGKSETDLIDEAIKAYYTEYRGLDLDEL